MKQQTIISFIIIAIVAVALFLGMRWLNQSVIPMNNPVDENASPMAVADIIDTTWVWSETLIGGDASVPPNKPGLFTITFGADGKISGTTDCNNFGGEYTLGSDGMITFGPFMSTLMYCEGSQETEFTGQLSQVDKLAVSAEGSLVMRLGETMNLMVFTKK